MRNLAKLQAGARRYRESQKRAKMDKMVMLEIMKLHPDFYQKPLEERIEIYNRIDSMMRGEE